MTTTSAGSPRAWAARQRYERSNARSATRSTTTSSLTPARPARTREGKRGTTLTPARPAHTPRHRLFGQATPGPPLTLRPSAPPRHHRQGRKPRGERAEPLDNKEGSLG